MFISALHTTTKTWKQCKYPRTDEQMRKLVHIHNGILFDCKKRWNHAIAATWWMDLESITLSGVRRGTERNSSHMWNIKKHRKETTISQDNSNWELAFRRKLTMAGGRRLAAWIAQDRGPWGTLGHWWGEVGTLAEGVMLECLMHEALPWTVL